MKFKITKASDFEYIRYREFRTLEEIRDFVKTENPKSNSCVIYWDTKELIIYDTWIE